MPLRQGQACTLRVTVININNDHLPEEQQVVMIRLPDGQGVQTSPKNLRPVDEDGPEGRAIRHTPQNKAVARPPQDKAMSALASDTGTAPATRDVSRGGDPNTETGPQYGDSPANRAAKEAGEDPFAEKARSSRRGK